MNPLPLNRPPGRPPQVVIHEHRDALRVVVQQALQAEGFDAHLTLDKAALLGPALSQGQPADVLLLDLDAPDVDGLALCRGLRRAYPRLGLLATSTRCDADLMARCLEAGADQLLSKPVSIVELSAHIRRLCVRAASWGEGESGPAGAVPAALAPAPKPKPNADELDF